MGVDQANIATALQEAGERLGTAPALVTPDGGRASFAELARLAERYGTGLAAAGIGRGTRVMLMVPPSLDFYGLTFALFRLGAVVILIDPGMGLANLRRCIGSVRPDALVAVPRVQLFARLFPGPFRRVRIRIVVGTSPGLLGRPLASLPASGPPRPVEAGGEDPAAIIFTTGSTGPPKGVCYTHQTFYAQLGLIRDFFGIGPGQVDQPGFPLFGLFSTALGAKVVVPDMDPTRPAKVDPASFTASIRTHGVSFSFGSPAIWNVVAAYCLRNRIRLPLHTVLMAGAPVAAELVERVQRVIDPQGRVFTPYGATEALPVTCISGQELLEQCGDLTAAGRGICVGPPLPGMAVRIMVPQTGPVATMEAVQLCEQGEIGEIIVQGPVVTRQYADDPEATRQAKIAQQTTWWHRMGDMGYLDAQGRLWFCGRKMHRVLTRRGVLYSVCCEAIFNTHPRVFRSALVGLGPAGRQEPVIIIEPTDHGRGDACFQRELLELAQRHEVTRSIRQVLFHPDFPVDIRHNAKIFREKLATWAASRVKAQTCLEGDGL